MRRNWRSAAVVLSVMATAALILPNAVGAQKVDNPGAFSLRGTAGRIVIGSALDLDLTPSDTPQCSDGTDNDGDSKIDAADPQCAAGPNGELASQDDNELVAGFQPKEDVSIKGNLAADGSMTVPTTGIYFPTYYVPLVHPVDGSKAVVKVKLDPTAAATGSINPLNGEMTLNVKMRALMTGNLWGNNLPSSCMIGTTANPISIQFTSGRVAANGNAPGLSGLAYSTASGSARVVNNTFTVPGASGCLINGWLDLNGTINQAMSLPSGSGKNYAILVGETTPVFGAGVTAAISSSPVTGDAPWSVVFNSSNSHVKKGPATYAWNFGDGSSSTEANPSHTFTDVGFHTVTLKVSDADGDSASTSTVVHVTGTSTTPDAPVPHIVTNPATPTGQAPFAVGFDGTSSVVADGPGTYAWNFGDGTTATGATASHTYTAAGTYTASLKVTDKGGQIASTAVVITVTAAPSEPVVPIARIVTTPTTPTGDAPFSVGFSGSTSTVDEGPGTYAWTFGDGGTATGVTSSHTYNTAGTYTATLKVTDATGDVSTASVTVTVTPKPVEPVSDDTVSVTLRGAINYANSGSGTGNLAIRRDSFGISSVTGSLQIPGASGGTAKVTVNIQRFWILQFWTGTVHVNDPGAKVSVSTPVLGGISGSTNPSSAGSTVSWFKIGNSGIQSYSLNWSVVDAG